MLAFSERQHSGSDEEALGSDHSLAQKRALVARGGSSASLRVSLPHLDSRHLAGDLHGIGRRLVHAARLVIGWRHERPAGPQSRSRLPDSQSRWPGETQTGLAWAGPFTQTGRAKERRAEPGCCCRYSAGSRCWGGSAGSETQDGPG